MSEKEGLNRHQYQRIEWKVYKVLAAAFAEIDIDRKVVVG